MNRPGTQLKILAERLFDRPTMDRLIDPVIADLQCEHAEAVRHGRLWRARWVRVASFIALCKVATFAAASVDRPGMRAIAVALAVAMLVTALAIGAGLAGAPATIHTHGNMVWLILYLVPQALAISLPVCLSLGLFLWVRGRGANQSTKRTIPWLMRLSLLLAVVNIGWITPAANTAYRNVVAGRATLRGSNELTFIELGQRVRYGKSSDVEEPLPPAFSMNARLALVIAPVLLGVLALAAATARRRSAAGVVFTTLTAFVSCYVLFPDADIVSLTRWLPAAAIAWIPNVIVALATVQFCASSWRRP